MAAAGRCWAGRASAAALSRTEGGAGALGLEDDAKPITLYFPALLHCAGAGGWSQCQTLTHTFLNCSGFEIG